VREQGGVQARGEGVREQGGVQARGTGESSIPAMLFR
jgi:hypothetical protein